MLARWAVWVATVLLTSAGAAQTPQAPAEKAIELVTLTFSVTDHQGHWIKDLNAEQFTVLDNGKPAKLAVFEGAGSRPLRVGMIIDKSRSMWERLPATQHALGAFAEEIIRPGSDKAFVLAFDEVLEQVTDFTSDPKLLSAGINSVRHGGASSVWDAIYFACRERLAREARDARLAIVLVSDTDDNQSHITRKEAIEMAERAGVTVYVIGTDEEPDRGAYSGKMLADATGGRALFPKTRDLGKALHEVAEDLSAQYYIAFRPPDLQHDGQFHSIQIHPEKKDLKARTRKGYYAPKQM
jgi:Ca-activated chloride channel family protein